MSGFVEVCWNSLIKWACHHFTDCSKLFFLVASRKVFAELCASYLFITTYFFLTTYLIFLSRPCVSWDSFYLFYQRFGAVVGILVLYDSSDKAIFFLYFTLQPSKEVLLADTNAKKFSFEPIGLVAHQYLLFS